jgi:hypothetical protein
VRKDDCELMFTLRQQAAGVRKQVIRRRSQSQVCDEVLREEIVPCKATCCSGRFGGPKASGEPLSSM